jgi:hypothetical protein
LGPFYEDYPFPVIQLAIAVRSQAPPSIGFLEEMITTAATP